MLLSVKNGEGVAQTIIAAGRETLVDRSAAIEAANTPQILMDVNVDRSGWFIQNLGTVPLRVSEIGDADVDTGFQVEPLGVWPPPGFPVTTGLISIMSEEAGALVIAREW